MSTSLGAPLTFRRGPDWSNRMMLAPLTNWQSHDDGVLSEEEFTWLSMRAKGGFGLVMTCATAVAPTAHAFEGQLAAHADRHDAGMARLAGVITQGGAVSSMQLHHGGLRAQTHLAPEVVAPSASPEHSARGVTTEEVEALRDAYVNAALRAERAGFDGVEVHGAHGYLLAQFLSEQYNRRDDRYGGSAENRARLLIEVVEGIRAACRPGFQLGLRLSAERYGLKLSESVELAGRIMDAGDIDYLDMSLWDVTKEPEEDAHQGQTLLSHFTGLPRNGVRLGAAGKIYTAADARWVLEAGCDFAIIGRGAILHHDFAARALADPDYRTPPTPVTPDYLRAEGLSPTFIKHMRKYAGFVADEEDA